GRRRRAVTAAAGARYLTGYGTALADTARHADAGRVRTAVETGILGAVPLQAALTAAAGAPTAAAVLSAVHPLAGRLVKAVSAT
ncbi:prenyltransferase, partial [Streptomyces sp. SID12488]|nr:prenyltransferase [Streptomyces sp. SID12488]